MKKFLSIADYLMDVVDYFTVGFVGIMLTISYATDRQGGLSPILLLVVFCFLWAAARRVACYFDTEDSIQDAAS